MDTIKRRAIEADCMALSHAFSYLLDTKDYQGLARLFAPNGTFIRTGVRLEGRDKIVAAMSQRPAEQFTRHLPVNFHFTHVDENVAKAVIYNVSYFGSPESALPLSFVPGDVMLLDFIDTYTCTPEGWLFLERDARPLLVPESARAKLPPAAFAQAAR